MSEVKQLFIATVASAQNFNEKFSSSTNQFSPAENPDKQLSSFRSQIWEFIKFFDKFMWQIRGVRALEKVLLLLLRLIF